MSYNKLLFTLQYGAYFAAVQLMQASLVLQFKFLCEYDEYRKF